MIRAALWSPVVLLALTASAVAGESIRVYEQPVRGMPLTDAYFKADMKKGEAWIQVELTTMPSEMDVMMEQVGIDPDDLTGQKQRDMAMVQTRVFLKRAPYPLTMEKDGNISILDGRGERVVCARAIRKHFLFFHWTKIKKTGHCVLDSFTNADSDTGKQTAIVELKVR
jgi:hypothetical protein